MATTEEKTQIVTFDGNTNNWRMWSRKFLSIATKKGWHEISTGKVMVPKADKVLDETTAAKKSQN